MTNLDREHLGRVRERFTRTAQQFASFALSMRSEEAERLANLALADFPAAAQGTAVDLACGPGTFTRAFAARVGFMIGLDLTPAMLGEAQQTAARAALTNLAFACADANALPLPVAAMDLAVCAYSYHHFLEPRRAIQEMARVLRPGGRLAGVDIIVPEAADPEWNNRIERARDTSHARTLTTAELHALVEAAGLRLLASAIGERLRQFDHWMQIVGYAPGSPAYDETRRLLETSMPGDTAGFHPRFAAAAAPGAPPELEFVQTSLFLVAEKR
ncbi:MAG: class I SAM-dependent methyltransferase [Acidobacteria bacterium]|nr:class I SAM-dependent methyltransferase [Acidobacteriota bacterium]